MALDSRRLAQSHGRSALSERAKAGKVGKGERTLGKSELGPTGSRAVRGRSEISAGAGARATPYVRVRVRLRVRLRCNAGLFL